MKFIRLLALAAIVGALSLSAAPIINIIPNAIAVDPGTTYGFGYDITNDDAVNYLVINGIGPMPDVPGVYSNMLGLDLPVVAPGGNTGIVNWVLNAAGLAEFTTDAVLNPALFPYSGNLLVAYQYYDGDPFAGGNPIGNEETASIAFRLTQQPGGPEVPEPSTYALLGTGLAAMLWLRRKA